MIYANPTTILNKRTTFGVILKIKFIQKRNNKKILQFWFNLSLVLLFTILLTHFLPEKTEASEGIRIGIFALIPAIFLISYIFITKRILEALIFASLMCFYFAERNNFLLAFNTTLINVLQQEDISWLIIVCGLMGSIIKLIEKAGGSFAFGNFVAKHSKTRIGTLLWTYFLGIIIFIDDYLNSLTVGSCMAPITDKHKVSREELSYIVDSTAAPVCVLLPISTWAVFITRLFIVNHLATEENAFFFFLKTIPFNFYAWLALIIVLLFILRIIPPIGRMKKANFRVKNGGPLAPEGSEKIDIRGKNYTEKTQGKIIDFILPIFCLIFSTIVSGVDMQLGVIITLGFMFILYVGRGILSANEFAEAFVEGLKNMLFPILLMILAFLFSSASKKIFFTETIIDFIYPIMQNIPQLMPVFIFIILGATEFITGTNWGLYIIALPVVIPLAQLLNVNMILVISAVLSAGVFGSHICFYSDATILSSSACGCDNFEHGITQMPYGFLAASISAILFTVFGFLLY